MVCIPAILAWNTRYLSSVPPPDKYGTRPFLRWVRSQAVAHMRLALLKITSAPSVPGNKPKPCMEYSTTRPSPSVFIFRRIVHFCMEEYHLFSTTIYNSFQLQSFYHSIGKLHCDNIGQYFFTSRIHII